MDNIFVSIFKMQTWIFFFLSDLIYTNIYT